MIEDLELSRDDFAGCFLASFDSGLVVGVDVDQRGVEADGTFEQRDECSDRERGDLVDRYRYRFAILLMKSRTRTQQEAGEIIAGSNVRFDLQRLRSPVFQYLNEGDEKVADSFSKLLNISMLIG